MAIKFLNTATAATQAVGDNSTKIATTAYADAAAAAIPIGNYLPLSAGSGFPLTGTLYGTSTNYSGSGDYAGNMTLGTGASTAEAHLTIGSGRTDSGFSYIDLVGDTTYPDFGLRIIRGNTGANASSGIYHRGTGNLDIQTTDSSSILLRTNNTTALTLSSSQNATFTGNVGIGTTSPAAKFDVASNTGNVGFNYGTSSSPERGNLWYDTDGSGWKFYIGKVQSSAFTSQVTIVDNGNVGIGTTSPTDKLTVNGNLSIFGNKIYNGSANNSAGVSFPSSTTRIDGFNGITFHSSSATVGSQTERMRITSAGNVGIGTTNPTKKLYVKDTSGTYEVATFETGAGGSFVRNIDSLASVETGVQGGKWTARTSNVARLVIDSTGNVGIGTTTPTETLAVGGNSITLSKTRGIGTNYATSEGWVAGGTGSFTSRVGYFGGSFGAIGGGGADNKVEYDIGPFGSRELVWMSVPETVSDDDGGWNKTMDGFNNSANNGFMSVIYVRRDAGTASGSFYHGCSSSNTLNLSGSANTNPYYTSTVISTLPADVWCVAIGIIHATNDTTTTNSALGGIYRLDTGQKIQSSTTFRQKTSNAIQQQRVYHYYSTSPTAQLDFTNPGFYILDGSEPTLGELLGSGSADDVFWSANGNNIHNDNSGNVGIGTTSPQAKFNVQTSTSIGWSNLANANILSGTTTTGIGIDTNEIAGKGGPMYIGTIDSGDDVYFRAGGASTRMIIKGTDGYVGIGTTSPESKLHIIDSSTSAQLRLNQSGNNDAVLGSGSNFFQIRTGSEGSSTALAILHSNQNVGIGTTSPSAKLHVEGNKSYSLGYLDATSDLHIGNDTMSSAVGAYSGSITFGSTNESNLQAASIVAVQTDTDPNEIGLAFFTQHSSAGSTDLVESMRIKNDGNVGIGTTSPARKLDVGGTFRVTGASAIQGRLSVGTSSSSDIDMLRAGANYITATNALGVLYFRTVNDIRMAITAAGNVGIGTTNPGAKLHVQGSSGGGSLLLIRDTNSTLGTKLATFIQQDGTNNPNLDISSTSTGILVNTGFSTGIPGSFTLQSNGGGSYLAFNTNSANERMRITAAGNVGIGTTSPDAKLQIVGKATSSSTVSADAATTLVTKDYVDSSAGNPSHFRQGFKTQSVGTAFSSALTVSLAAHTGCYVTLCCFGDWGSHSTAAYRGEFFLQNGGSSYNEPGVIIRQDDNTSDGTDQIICQIVDPPGSSGNRDFVIQIRHTDNTSPTSFSGTITFTVQGKFNSVT